MLNRGGVKNIIDSINTIGYICNPIIVNEKYEVIDGQHRLEAFRALAIPVDYIMVKGAGIEECRLLNRKQGNWTTLDYLKSYARGGNKNYIRLYDLMIKHPKQKLCVVTYAIADMQATTGAIADGQFICDKEMYKIAEERLIFADRITDSLRKVGGRCDYLTMASIYAYENETVNKFRLEELLTSRASTIRPAVSFVDALDCISDAYNYKARRKIFLQTDWVREHQEQAYNNKKGRETKMAHRKRNTGAGLGELEERRTFYE